MISIERFEGQMIYPMKSGKRYSMIHVFHILLELTKFKISLFAALSTFTGFILAHQELSGEIIFPVMGVFLLACGSCALNQYQEREDDRRMERTKDRPIPSGKLRPHTALLISIGLILSGSLILFYGTNLMAWGLGLFAMVWYNGVYTYLKRKSAFAAIPGALVGSIPPLVGWISWKGHLSFDSQILAVAFFFYMWQVPHFWLLLLNFGKDYERAGFPSLTRIFSSAQLSRMTFMWIFGTAMTCMMIPLYGVVESPVIRVGLFAAAFWLMWKDSGLLKVRSPEFPLHFPFNTINSFALLVMALITLDTLFY
jgi:protoheme IX farnesyltransferase